MFVLTVLQTANFKLDPLQQMTTLRRLQPDKPIMAMEFWTGWFDHWDQPEHIVFRPQGKHFCGTTFLLRAIILI